MIHQSKLPPRSGYVEAEDEDGNRFYKPISKIDDRVSKLESESGLLSAQVKAQSDRSEFVEDCIAEMATRVYAQ